MRRTIIVSLCAAGLVGLGPAGPAVPLLGNGLVVTASSIDNGHVLTHTAGNTDAAPPRAIQATVPGATVAVTAATATPAAAGSAPASITPSRPNLNIGTTNRSQALLPEPAVRSVPPSAAPWLGVLEPDGSHSGAERAAGMTVVDWELHWKAYEPSPGVVDRAYVAQMRSLLNSFRAAGMQVILQPGIEDAPAWVYTLDANTRFVNQYGDVFNGDSEGPVANAVFDAAVQHAQQAYIGQIFSDFGDAFFGVRVGGLQYGELKYPTSTYNGHSNSYWAFDGAAQAGSPVPGWRPGQADPAKASAFLDYYTQKLTAYQNLLISSYRAHSSGWLFVLYPSWGLRPGDMAAAAARNLDGSTLAAGWNTLAYGSDWARQVAAISDSGTVPYTTWLERGDDSVVDPVHMSPLRYLASLAHAHHLQVAGENAGPGAIDLATLGDIVARIRAVGAVGVMWFYEPSVVAASGAGLRTLGAAAAWGSAAAVVRLPRSASRVLLPR